MHELPVTQSILNIAVSAAERAGGRRVLAIDLVIGDLSTFVDESVQFYFDIISMGTLAQGAALRFSRRPGTAACLDCRAEFSVRVPLAPACPTCGSARVRVTGGQEFFVDAIEVEDAP